VDISMDEFDVVIQSLPPTTGERQILMNWMDIAIQTDPSFLLDGMTILLEPDNTVAIRKFIRKFSLRQIAAQKDAQAQSEQEQQMQEQQLMMQQQLAQMQQQGQMELQTAKNQGNIQKTLITSKTKMNGEKLRLLGK
jgi:hypothetical protein